MAHSPEEQIDRELDALLRESRPSPRTEWVQSLETRLFHVAGDRLHLWRRPRVRLGAAFAAALAALVLVLAFIGSGPLGGNADVNAKDDCRLVEVVTTERVPTVVESAHGGSSVAYHNESVRRLVRRCR